jgi:nucleotide-binding universal stress UspA family protein
MMRVVIATDGSKQAEEAVRICSSIPGAKGWEFKLVSVQMSLVTGMYDDLTYGMLIEGESVRTKQALDKCESLLKEAGITSTSEQGIGHAGDEIVRLAQEWKADLIVIGARGHSTLDRVLLGSTSDFVATHARCSVLVIRPASHGADAWAKSMKILVPFDDCDAARKSLTTLQKCLSQVNAHVEMLHVIERPALHDASIRYDPIWYDKIKSIMEEAKPLLGSNLASKTAVKVVEASYVSERICEELVKNKIDLVAVGERGRSTISRVFLGSNSRHLLRHAPCSVLLVR